MNLTKEKIDFIKSNIYFIKEFKTNLLYRGTRNGWSPLTFHSLCDNKGPTITFFKAKGTNRTSAGIAYESWDSTSGRRDVNGGLLLNLEELEAISPRHSISSILCYKD